jgi:hypothetical protein
MNTVVLTNSNDFLDKDFKWFNFLLTLSFLRYFKFFSI